MLRKAGRFSSRARERLSSVLQTAKELVSIADAVKALAVDRRTAAKTLARWQQQGWLRRVGPGLYAPIPVDALTSEQVLKDPWVLVPALYAPGYIGGWTAAEHWNFTEQIFRTIFVFTAQPFRKKAQSVQGVSFVLKRIPESRIFGTKNIWRGQSRILIADKHRTIVDLLADPESGGGIRHVESCLRNYLKDSEADARILIQYGEKLGNGAVFKRLGFLLSQNTGNEVWVDECRRRLTQGNAKLDPALPSQRLVKAWRLWIPKTWTAGRPDD